ncbi:hypothetical protein HNP60_001974 [Sphingobium sp. B1D3A]|uniref:Uncharacterized protein n=1 Tax=Sphingobium lignivorans TaxID=2735886 RepID=A0ABR6NFE8_9SPHN|nr:hypothetical protein [Sphingobium lignivorans]
MKGRPIDREREAARLLGVTRYVGPMCKRGHDGERYTSTGACCACLNDRRKGPAHETQIAR